MVGPTRTMRTGVGVVVVAAAVMAAAMAAVMIVDVMMDVIAVMTVEEDAAATVPGVGFVDSEDTDRVD